MTRSRGAVMMHHPTHQSVLYAHFVYFTCASLDLGVHLHTYALLCIPVTSGSWESFLSFFLSFFPQRALIKTLIEQNEVKV